jgi:hypothetical protein
VLFIDPKGEFVSEDHAAGAIFAGIPDLGAIEVGQSPIPLDFLPDDSVGNASVTQAAMRFRDSLALCCSRPGDI